MLKPSTTTAIAVIHCCGAFFIMNDLQNMIMMLAKSNETFEKAKSGNDWTLNVTGRGVIFYFNSDGDFQFMCLD